MSEREVTLRGGKPWGIRLQGGAGTTTPLQIAIVTPGSKAAQQDVRNGSRIEEINGDDVKNLSMTEAEDLIKRSGDTLRLRLIIPKTNEEKLRDEILSSVNQGGRNLGKSQAKGNTFNMVREHVDAGVGSRVLSQFDVAQNQRNKAIATTAPKAHQHIIEDQVESKEPSKPNPGRVVILRGGQPWGMRLKGGKDLGTPLCIESVTPGSKAYNEGLLVDDRILSLNNVNTEDMRLSAAQDIIRKTGDELKLNVTREAMAKRLLSAEDEAFFNDLRISMGIGGPSAGGGGRDVKGNAFKKLQQVVGTGV